MEPDPLVLPGRNFASRRQLNTAIILSILWNSAFKSVYRAFIILLFGNIALGIAGSILQFMTPSKGPGISFSLGHWGDWTSAISRHSFGILWILSLISLSVFRLALYLPDARHRNFVKRLRRIERRVSENWFRLLVSNAIGAMISAFVISLVSQFSWSAFLWSGVIQPILAWVFHFVSALIGARSTGAIQDWMNWYTNNTLKFTFWSIYLGSIADDLGLPNVKALGRWLWKRIRRRLGLADPGPSPVARDVL